MMPEEAARLLSTPGTEFVGSDWSYGWPADMRLDGSVFHPVHLAELDQFEVDAFGRLTGPLLGVVYQRDESGIDFTATRRGFCARGVVGAGAAPLVSAAWVQPQRKAA